MEHSCPSCNGVLDSDHVEICPHCGYNYSLLAHYYKDYTLSKDLSLLTDHTSTLSEKEKKRLQKDLNAFQSTFPGCFFAVFLESSKGVANTKALWILNQQEFHQALGNENPQNGLLLYLDPEQQSAALAYGLGFSAYISLPDSNQLIRTSLSLLSDKKYLLAIQQIIKATSDHLITQCPQ